MNTQKHETKGEYDDEFLIFDDEDLRKTKNSHRKNKIMVTFSVIISFLVVGLMLFRLFGYVILVGKYDDLVLPGIYLNDVNLKNVSIHDLGKIIDDYVKMIKDEKITVISDSDEYKYNYDELGISINSKVLKEKVFDYLNELSLSQKIMLINETKTKRFYLKASYENDSINDFIDVLKLDFNTDKKSDGLLIDDSNNVYYDEGEDGFFINEESTKQKIIKTLNQIDKPVVIKLDGRIDRVIKRNEELSKVNKKISSYTTYFVNAGNRGHNISLASKRLNGTLIMPGEEFSYLKVVGPYGSSNGYLPAPIYLNGDTATANGGGVCQLASTLYMAQLKAGLETVERRNHTFAPGYVPKGLDATVYSTTTDYKFKNDYDYPIYITSYVNGNYLTVDIWSNDTALGGKTFEPYSVYQNGAYLSYLKVIENDVIIATKYLGKSVYKTMR